MKLKHLLVPIFALVTCGFLKAQTSDAVPSPSPAHEGHWRHHDHWLWKKLNLTDAQKQQIQTIRENNRKNPAFRNTLVTYLRAKKSLQDDVTKNLATNEDAATLGAAAAELAVLRTQQQNEIKAILSPDQQQTWNEFQAKRATWIQNRIDRLTQPES